MPQCSVNPASIALTNHAALDFNYVAEVQRLHIASRPEQVYLYAAEVGGLTCSHEAASKVAGKTEVNASS